MRPRFLQTEVLIGSTQSLRDVNAHTGRVRVGKDEIQQQEPVRRPQDVENVTPHEEAERNGDGGEEGEDDGAGEDASACFCPFHRTLAHISIDGAHGVAIEMVMIGLFGSLDVVILDVRDAQALRGQD